MLINTLLTQSVTRTTNLDNQENPKEQSPSLVQVQQSFSPIFFMSEPETNPVISRRTMLCHTVTACLRQINLRCSVHLENDCQKVLFISHILTLSNPCRVQTHLTLNVPFVWRVWARARQHNMHHSSRKPFNNNGGCLRTKWLNSHRVGKVTVTSCVLFSTVPQPHASYALWWQTAMCVAIRKEVTALQCGRAEGNESAGQQRSGEKVHSSFRHSLEQVAWCECVLIQACTVGCFNTHTHMHDSVNGNRKEKKRKENLFIYF